MAEGQIVVSEPDTHDVRRWPAPGKAKGVVFFLHGYGLHQMAFRQLFECLNNVGYDVISHDALCHGRSKIPLNSATILQAQEASCRIYERFEHERPILYGVGTFGGFLVRGIIESVKGKRWIPPVIFNSVEYVRVPAWLLDYVDHPWLLRCFDVLKFGYDYRLLTHDPEADVKFIEGDPLIQRKFSLGSSFRLALSLNRFYDGPPMPESRHAFIMGSDDRLCYLEPVLRWVARQPDYKLFTVEGACFHIHREAPEIRKRFEHQLDAALSFVTAPAAAA